MQGDTMTEVNFCPFCDSSQHKILTLKENMYFCKECNKFFNLEHIKLQCPKCNGVRIEDSDFPSPNGEVVFHCKSCKKMFSAKEFLEKNEDNNA